MTVYRALQDAWIDPDRAWLLEGQGRHTYGELEAEVARARGWLWDHGLRRGNLLALRLPRGRAQVVLPLAALSLGIATLPINPRYTSREVQQLLDDAQPTVTCLDADGLEAQLATSLPRDADPQVGPDDLALLCYTSGTTGRPKGARILHRNLHASIEALHVAWRWRRDDVLVHALPLFHIHGLIVAMLGALRAGASTVLLPAFDAAEVVAAMRRHHATVFMGVPTFYHRLLQHPDLSGLAHLRLFTSGSAPLPAATHQAFLSRTGHTILERYGMTEIGIVLSNPYDGPRKPGTVGLPLPGVEAEVVGGELRIRGASVFPGYLRRPDATAAALKDGWMATGDLARVDDDGWIVLQGRRSDLILVGGFNVYPSEIEAVLLEHEAVTEIAVVGVPDPDLGERVVATCVGSGLPPAELMTWARERLAGYKVPRHVSFVDALPRNAMGKVRKNLLRQQWRDALGALG